MIGKELGPYTIDAELGTGGMGTVYRATGPDGIVALKTIHPHLLDSPGYFKRFLREAEIGRKVDCANVVRTLDVDATGTHHFLVMEYVEGQTLRELIRELECVPEELCRHIACEIAKALEAMHALGVVHRDLKPENVLITGDHVVKVMDLGVAQLADAAMQLSQTGVFLGSVLYAAPEQFASGKTDHRADLYSLGLMLYELATGRHPSRAEDFAQVMRIRIDETPRPPSELNPQLSPFFEEVISTLLKSDVDERFASAVALREALEERERGPWWADRATLIRARTKRPLRRVRIPRDTALYGRDADLEKLKGLFALAEAGEGQVVLLEGEAGIGKTRLIDEFVARLNQEGADVNFLFGSYPPGGAATEAGAFSTAYREHFGEGSIDEYLETPVLAPAFSALLRGEPTPKGEQPLSKDSLQTVFVQATRALARERPTILLVDDLHFAPPEGRALFAALAMAVPGHRVLLIGTARHGLSPEWVAGIERAPHASRLELARLGPKDLAKLLVDAFHSERLAGELSFKIATKSDGNPFFVFEIIQGLREGQFLRRDEAGNWVTTRIIEEIEVPSSVADLIHGRIASLSEEEREILDVAACCGFQFDGSLVAEAIGAERIPTLRRLARIEKQHRLVRASGRRFVFDHHQVQEALYAGLPEMLREEYHAALGEALERAELSEDDVVEVCEHFFAGGRPARAKPHLPGALARLDSGYLNEAALRLLGRALEAPGVLEGNERVESLLEQSQRLGRLGRRDEQRVVLDEARALADRGEDRILQAQARVGQIALLGNTSQYDAAKKLAVEVLAIAVEAGHKQLEAAGHEYLCHILDGQGRHAEAVEHSEQALALHAGIDDPRGLANLLTQRGTLLVGLGRLEEARALHAESAAVADRAGNRAGVAIATGNLGSLLVRLGRYAEGLECYGRCMETFAEIGARRPLAVAFANLGDTWVALGDVERARDYCERTIDLAAEIRAPFLEAYARQTLGALCTVQGRHEEAEQHLNDALEINRAIAAPQQVAETLTSIADLYGWGEQARPALEEALAIAEGGHMPTQEVMARAGLAQLPGGDATAALAAFGTHRAAMRARMQMHALYLLWKATGDRAHLDEARLLLDRIRDHAPKDCRDSMIANVPLHQEVMEASGA